MKEGRKGRPPWHLAFPALAPLRPSYKREGKGRKVNKEGRTDGRKEGR